MVFLKLKWLLTNVLLFALDEFGVVTVHKALTLCPLHVPLSIDYILVISRTVVKFGHIC